MSGVLARIILTLSISFRPIVSSSTQMTLTAVHVRRGHHNRGRRHRIHNPKRNLLLFEESPDSPCLARLAILFPMAVVLGSIPSRQFAKCGIMSTCAIMTILFDIGALADEKTLKMDSTFHDLENQHLSGKVPFRIRKIQRDFWSWDLG